MSINNLKQGIYSLKCKSLEYYNAPFIAENDEGACYMVKMAIAGEKIPQKQAEDITIVRIGTWSAKEGIIDHKSYDVKEAIELI